MLNTIRIAAIINSNASSIQLQAASFHSTRVLERRKRTHWDSGGCGWSGSSRRSNYYRKRERKLYSKRELLHNVGSFAEQLFQSWRDGAHDNHDSSESRSSSWFRQEFMSNGYRGWKSRNKGRKAYDRDYPFFVDLDDFEVENDFRSAFGGKGYTFYSFRNFEEPQWRGSSCNSNYQRFYWSWDRQHEEETESDNSDSDLASDRLALGLSSSGPLSLDEVKNAYRSCALKWHPDRHSGSSKAVAEEKFKLCSAAYQSLCDKLALN